MSIQVKKLHAALKHGAYSATAVLPGEDLEAFKKLHQECIAHYAPVGPLEDDVIATMARLLWRKQNLATFRLAELALEYEGAIRKEKLPTPLEIGEFGVLPGRREAALQATEDQARKELGDRYALVEIGATVDRLLQELYRVPEIVTRGRFPDGGESDSTWRTQEARHVGSDTIAPGF